MLNRVSRAYASYRTNRVQCSVVYIRDGLEVEVAWHCIDVRDQLGIINKIRSPILLSPRWRTTIQILELE